jgi:hypothetical protein
MPKYKVRAIQSIEHIYYIKAECSFEAEEKAERRGEDSDESDCTDGWEIVGCEKDDSLDEDEESDLKEKRWNKDLQ